MDVESYIAKWSQSAASERANKDAFLVELCDVLEVPRPDPARGIPEKDTYVFERDAYLARAGGRGSIGKIDLYKEGCFLLEAKQGSRQESAKLGMARRGTPAWNIAMRDALGQALGYARTLDRPPPFLLVCDIGYCFDVYASFDGSTAYRGFPDSRRSRIFLEDLAEHRELLRDVFLDPHSLDPARHKTEVTREIARDLAELARDLEEHHPSGRVSRFLMRCIFTMFAQDVGLLPGRIFTQALDEHWIPHPEGFVEGIKALWRAMYEGGFFLGDAEARPVPRFGGHLFSDRDARLDPLKLQEGQLRRLHAASLRDWAQVEPAIFGTLLEGALSAEERHRLGAHYTPRAYVERLVQPTVEEPLRRDWNLVQAEVRKLVEAGREKAAVRRLQRFHQDLVHVRVLDPACGSGNFLYVALDLFKRLESEVVGLLAALGNIQPRLEMERAAVTPEQFKGIEVKRWAKEIADLVLWIGYLQWQVRTYGGARAIPEPILRDFGNIEHRDALLEWDGEPVPAYGEDGEMESHWDGATHVTDPVTGGEVPDPEARVPVYEYPDARRAEWPEADFVVGNPPFIGNHRMRAVLGHGYAETLRRVHHDVPDSVDYVMYWWNHAAKLVKAGKVRRFGLITTNSISQKLARRVVAGHMEGRGALSLVYVVPDHPWTDDASGADVRIAMTVARRGDHTGVLARVVAEERGELDRRVEVVERRGKIHPDLTIGPDVGGAVPLRANEGIASPGVKLHGQGFLVTREEAESLGWGTVPGLKKHVRPYQKGRALLHDSGALLVLDFFGLEEAELRDRFPAAYQWLLDHMKAKRQAREGSTPDSSEYAKNWWLFGKTRPVLRAALAGLERYVATVETAKHRIFVFLPAEVLPDNMLINVATDDAYHLGVLSSRFHLAWALVSGGRQGVGNDPRYTKTRCFDPFPFPAADDDQARRIRDLGEALDRHRKERQAEHPDLGLTDLYNVLEKERAGAALSDAEREVHAAGLVAVLRQLHDELDAAVADAYGWPADLEDEEVLERLVALNAERAEEERDGRVRWLRPGYQAPDELTETQPALPGAAPAEPEIAAGAISPWPKKLPERITAVHDLLSNGGEWTPAQVARSFRRARTQTVKEVLDSLAAVGLAACFKGGGEPRWRGLGSG